MVEENKALVRRWFDEVFTQGHLQLVDEFVTPNYVLHDANVPREVHGREGIKRHIDTYRAANPDLYFAVEDQIAEGDMVVTRWTAREAAREELSSISSDDSRVMMSGIEFDRIVGYKIDEAWVSYHIFAVEAIDPERVKRALTMMHHAFPDLRVAEADSVTEGDKVAFRYMMSGTHRGEFMGVAPTGERITVMGMDIVRIGNGEILEYWGEFDVMGMLRQLGIAPPPQRTES